MEWQKNRTAAQEHRSSNILAPIGYWPHVDILEDHQRYDENLGHLFYIGRAVLGANCDASTYPATAKLLRGITKDMRIMEFTVKYHLLRARPYHLEPKFEPTCTYFFTLFCKWPYAMGLHTLLCLERACT